MNTDPFGPPTGDPVTDAVLWVAANGHPDDVWEWLQDHYVRIGYGGAMLEAMGWEACAGLNCGGSVRPG